MSIINDLVTGVKKAIPGIVAKICTFLLLIFALGMFFGYYIVAQKGAIYLLVPLVSMMVMYYKLDEGFLVFAVLMAVAILF